MGLWVSQPQGLNAVVPSPW